MTVAFIVSAYKAPALLGRLLHRLDGRPCAVHIDAKVEAAVFGDALRGVPRLHLLPRHVCHWGGFGHVEASLEGIRWFVGTGATHAVLLTGQCYPLRPIEAFERWLCGVGDASIISHLPLPHPRWRRGGLDRLEEHHFRFLGRPWHVRLRRRALPAGLTAHGGSSYWCLSRAAAARVIAFVDRRPDVVDFFRHVWIPDETFFQTILASVAHDCTLIDDDVHHIEWTPHLPNPGVIADPGPALASGRWFARKFDDEAVLDEIDSRALHRGSGLPPRPMSTPRDTRAEAVR